MKFLIFRPKVCYAKGGVHQCKIIFDANPNTEVTELFIFGRFDDIPDLSDAVIKFENLEYINLSFLKLKIVQRTKLTAFKEIKSLKVSYNEIAELEADTFNDLKNLQKLGLHSNKLKELHPDIFKELQHLETLWLGENQLEVIHPDLFRTNVKLEEIFLQKNKIKKVEFDFSNMPQLFILGLEKNVCIDARFCGLLCGRSSWIEMNEKIQKSCSD